MALQPGDLQLKHVRQEISKRVSFPEELSSLVNEEKGQQLLAEINACQTHDELLTLTYSLSRKRLNDLFSAVLVLSAASGEDTFNRLLTIFQLRSTISLTQTAWAFYQRHYPNDRLGRVLMTLVQNIKEQSDQSPFIQELQGKAIDALLAKRLAENLFNDSDRRERARLPIQTSDASENEKTDDQVMGRVSVERLREQYPLFAAYTSLSDIPMEAGHNPSLQTGLCGYMIRLSLLPETPFAAAFLTAYFAHADDSEILNNGDLFIQALRISRRGSQVILLQRFLNRHRLGSEWTLVNQVIRDLFGVPSVQDAPIDLKPPETQPVTQKTARFVPPAVKPSQPEPAAPWPSIQTQAAESKRGLFNRLFKGKQIEPPAAPSPVSPKIQKPVEIKPTVQESQQPACVDEESCLIMLKKTLVDQMVQSDVADDETSIWKAVDRSIAVRFRQWTLIDQLNHHCEDDERKKLFFRRYALSIAGVHHWDDETLLIDLDCCYLASHQSDEGRVWYYDRNTLAMLAESRINRPQLNQPQQPFITARDAMLRQTVNNIVQLPLDDVNLLYANDFMQRVITDAQSRT